MPSIEEATGFYVNLLGFRKSDWRDGRAMFLRCSPDYHTVNFFRGEPRLAHLAFGVKDFPELVRASDLLVRNGFPLDRAPARHTIGHNCACYHRKSGQHPRRALREMARMLDEELGYFDPEPWHEDRPQRPRNWECEDSPRNKWIPGAVGNSQVWLGSQTQQQVQAAALFRRVPPPHFHPPSAMRR